MRTTSRKKHLCLKFTYECGCKGRLVRDTVPICCPKHGDLVCVNGEALDVMLINATTMENIFKDAGVPGQLDFSQCER